VRAVSLNGSDRENLVGSPAYARWSNGLRRPRRPVPGSDVAGVVAAVGSAVTEYAVGDELFGELMEGKLQNTAEVTGKTYDPKPANNKAEDEVTARPLADVAIEKTRTQPYVVRNPVTYTLAVPTLGPAGSGKRHSGQVGETAVGRVAVDRQDLAVDAHRERRHRVVAVLVEPPLRHVSAVGQPVQVAPHHSHSSIPHGGRRKQNPPVSFVP